MCDVLEVSRSGYYKWCHHEPSEQELERVAIKQEIYYSFHYHNGRYGSPRIKELLHRQGYNVCLSTVTKYMREMGLNANTKFSFTKTTDSNHENPIYPNRVQQDFQVDAPNKVWVADITYIPTLEGFLYLATIIDLYSRKVVGLNIDDQMTVELPLKALKQATVSRQPAPGFVHHSDRGSQYASKRYTGQLDSMGAEISMSRKGNCYDNAVAESFHSTLKKDKIYCRDELYQTKAEAKQDIVQYIIQYYNNERIHSTLDYLSPNEFEQNFMSEKSMSAV